MANVDWSELQHEEGQQVEAEADWRNENSSDPTALHMPCAY